jgi:hypothetical protein
MPRLRMIRVHCRAATQAIRIEGINALASVEYTVYRTPLQQARVLQEQDTAS